MDNELCYTFHNTINKNMFSILYNIELKILFKDTDCVYCVSYLVIM